MLSKLRRVPRQAALLRRPQPLPRPGARLCSGSRKPPKGFEGFFKSKEAKEAAKPAESSAKPAETAAEGSKPGPKEAEGKAEGKESRGPKETPVEGEAKAEGTSGKGEAKGEAKGKPQGPQGPERLRLMALLAGGVLAAGSYFSVKDSEAEDNEVTMQEMIREYLTKGQVEKIQIVNESQARVFLRKDSGGPPMVTINLGRPEAFEQKLESVQNDLGIPALEYIPVQYVHEVDYIGEILPYVPSLLFLIPLLMVGRSLGSSLPGGGGPGGRNVFSIGKAFPSGKKDLKSQTKFIDVAGLEQAKAEVVEFVDFLKEPKKYEKLGARVPRGGLFVGPPGTGKTLLAKAVAGEADCPFYSMSGSDFVEMYVGVGASRVRDLFKQARDNSPSIIFIDEIDAIGRKRGKGGFTGGNDERESTLNQMLVEMDGFNSSTGVVVLAGTNRVDILDNALLRPGRFDRQIAIDRPDMSEREQIYMVHLKPLKLEEGLDRENVAKRMAALTPGFAGADISNVCNEAAIFAARRAASSVAMDDFERATERVIGGLPKNNSLMSKDDKRTVAIHESGHAVAGWFLEHADPLLKVSIQPRSSGALGFAQYLPAEMSLFSKEAILDKIAVSLGGRAAEELFVGKISTGASDDLDKVTKMAHAMVANYGMSEKIGLLNFGNNDASSQFYKPYSEATGQLIDKETRELVDNQYERVKKLLLEHQEKLKGLADKLDEKETLGYTELVEALGERPYGIKKEIKSFVTAGGPTILRDAEPESGATDGNDAGPVPA
ncbi:unnamed protein product [Effrenium voratum]|uniref:AAA+ ATPase domain-containing protein n=1 Tax=Effrenium voratum TaxID=2562239 RepID=A0AA36J8Q9_9DINO|nr:unnamed protein product [Effrenium voratum]CAJ1415985.1 unnamed protein product [Effrenium voratum]